jgi:Protein of unknown function (DUF2568)
MRALSLALKFVLELAAFAAFAYCGASAGSGAVSVVLAIAAPAVAIVLWGLLAAPRSKRRLPSAARIPFELSVFASAIVALLLAGAPIAAAVLTMLVVMSTALLTRFHQWDA